MGAEYDAHILPSGDAYTLVIDLSHDPDSPSGVIDDLHAEFLHSGIDANGKLSIPLENDPALPEDFRSIIDERFRFYLKRDVAVEPYFFSVDALTKSLERRHVRLDVVVADDHLPEMPARVAIRFPPEQYGLVDRIADVFSECEPYVRTEHDQHRVLFLTYATTPCLEQLEHALAPTLPVAFNEAHASSYREQELLLSRL